MRVSATTNISPDTVEKYQSGTISRLATWGLTLLVAAFAAALRFIRLGSPHALVFDETYYVKDAWTMLLTGEARDWPKELLINGQSVPIDNVFASGDTHNWLSTAEYVVHPPIGKWCIALGLQLFGGADNAFAWRASTAIAGTIAVILLIRITLRLFHSVPIALIAGMLMSVDGVGIVMSRTGLLDNFIMVFALGAFSLLLVHRDWANTKLQKHFTVDSQARSAKWRVVTQRSGHIRFVLNTRGPSVAFSWWRVGAAVLLGLATSVKWSGIYFFAVFCVISVIWDALNRRKVGYRGWFISGITKDGLLAAAYMVPLWIGIYVAGWTSWFIHSDSYMHDWAKSHPGQGLTWLPESVRSFVQYHIEMWQFHTTLDAPHDYKANPLTWPLQIRPTSFYWRESFDNSGLCALAPRSQCVAAVTSLGNPLIWWLGSACLLVGIVIAITRRDWKIWAVLAGFLGGWLPWAQYLNRTTFTFYSIVILPWIILAICYVASWLQTKVSRGAWNISISITLSMIVIVSIFFYPIWTAIPVPYEFWLSHMWLRSWI